MASRIKAIKSTFNLMLSLIEIFVSVVLVLKMFSSGGELSSIIEDASGFADWMGSGSESIFDSSEISGPMSALVLILGFMFFSYFLIMIFPKIVEKKEREFDLEEIDLE